MLKCSCCVVFFLYFVLSVVLFRVSLDNVLLFMVLLVVDLKVEDTLEGNILRW